jgi:hypothetical protein
MYLQYQLMKTRQDERLRAAARDHLAAEARRARTAGRDHAAARVWRLARMPKLWHGRMLSRRTPA